MLERGINELIGTYQQSKNYGFVVPDNLKFSRDIFIPIEKSKGAVNGHKVLVKLVSYGDQNRNPEGEVVKIIGHINDPGVDILSVVYAHDLPQEFPERVLNQAERMNVPVSEADTFGRTDLRDLLMVTIDGEDAKDLDDAVSLTKDENGWHLGVHIADVANYVQENSALDREALKRGTSVYLADRVIPMLPHALSNGICSLNEGLDRLALSCLMDIDEKGQVTGHQIVESVIRTNHRMSYTQVKKILADEDQDLAEAYADVVPMLKEMNVLAKLLREHRRNGVPLTLISRRRRSIWTKTVIPQRSFPMTGTTPRSSSKILCSLRTRPWRRIFTGRRFPSSTGCMRRRTRRKSRVSSASSRISATTSKATGRRFIPKNSRSFWQKFADSPEEV